MQIFDTNLSRRVLLGGAALAVLPFSVALPARAEGAPEAERDVNMAEVLKAGTLAEMTLGKDDAPISIVEYFSMTCSHCANFHNKTFEALKTKYIDTGKVRFVAREFPFDPRAAAAFMLARCAPKEQYFPFVSMLFKQQASWAAAQDGRAALLQMSRLAGFSEETFNACLTNQKLLDDVNAVRERGTKDFGINSTPTFIINGKVYTGDMSIDQMSAILDKLG